MRLRELKQARLAAVILRSDDPAPELMPAIRRRLLRLATQMELTNRDEDHLGRLLRLDAELVESLRVPNPGPVARVENKAANWW